jgi:hypothetical protein
MRAILRVRWTIVPQTAPQPWIVCSGCGGLRPYQSSGKVRLNANGRKLDSWLIYRCLSCDKTWNRPIFERRNVREIDPGVLAALQANDPHWVRLETFNIEALKRSARRVDEFPEYEVQKEVLSETRDWKELAIQLIAPFPLATRLDRLLASELKMSRTRLQSLYDNGRIQTHPDQPDILRRRIKTGTQVTLDMSDKVDREKTGDL